MDHCARLSGAEIGLLRLLPALTGVDIHVLLAENGPLVSKLEQLGAKVEVLPLDEVARGLDREAVTSARLPLRSAFATVLYIFRSARKLRELRADVVHAYSLKAGIYGCLAARLAKVPALWHVHDRIEDDYLPLMAVRLVRLALRCLPDAIVVSSKAVAMTIETDRVRPRIIPYSLPADWARFVKITPSRSDVRIGIVGRISPWKGQDVFLQAFAAAFGSSPGVRAEIIGAPLFGEDEYEESLRHTASSLGIQDAVAFCGFVDDIPEALGRLDVLVHASIIPEPFGQVIVEGMAAGLAVIATDTGGPSEIVTHGHDGLLVPPGDVQSLATVMQRLAGDAAMRATLGANARASVRRYAPEVIAPMVTSLYREIVP